MSYKRVYTSFDKGHRHHVDLPLAGLPLRDGVYCQPCNMRGFGDTEQGDPRFIQKTAHGVTYKLATEEGLAQLISEVDWYVSPTAGKVVTWAGVSIKASEVAWIVGQGAVPWLNWVDAERARGQAVIGSSGESMPGGGASPTVDGTLVREDQGILVSTRDLDLVGKLSAADPGAVVLFEPKGGWKRPMQLAGGLALAALFGGAIYFYFRETGRR
jgi:hypothetical protein